MRFAKGLRELYLPGELHDGRLHQPAERLLDCNQALQGEQANLEDKLSAVRQALNAAVMLYNTGREGFPAVLFAGPLGFQIAEFNQPDDSEKGVVDQLLDVQF